jgi:glycosyltransferase involved in cell wall biosynthesis
MKNILNQNESVNGQVNTCPFFSVIITTYNRADLLKRAIKSLISQTEKDWEAIIVDDESTDDSYVQILPFLKRYSGIKYIKQPHGGEASSKNTGIKSASGKFITFLDSDDEFDPLHLESRRATLMRNPSIQFLYGGVKIIGNQFVPDRFNYNNKINLNNCVIGGTFFIDRNIAISLNGFRHILLGADADLFERAKAEHVTMMEVLQSTYIYHHETEDSITNKLLQNN